MIITFTSSVIYRGLESRQLYICKDNEAGIGLFLIVAVFLSRKD
jgi:hypothetical protein